MSTNLSVSPKKTKKPYYRQKYNPSWENDVNFVGWLTKSKKGRYESYF